MGLTNSKIKEAETEDEIGDIVNTANTNLDNRFAPLDQFNIIKNTEIPQIKQNANIFNQFISTYSPGLIGSTGPQGPIGPIGPVGPKGPTGLTGPQGPAGSIENVNASDFIPTFSTHFAPLDQFNMIRSTEIPQMKQNIQMNSTRFSEFISTYTPGSVGPMGPAGPPGQQGLIGPQGPMGLSGSMGPVGPMGPMGPSGLNGSEGPMGQAGPMGPAGPSGLNGSVGPMGPMGPAGPKGDTGPMGSAGQPSAVLFNNSPDIIYNNGTEGSVVWNIVRSVNLENIGLDILDMIAYVGSGFTLVPMTYETKFKNKTNMTKIYHISCKLEFNTCTSGTRTLYIKKGTSIMASVTVNASTTGPTIMNIPSLTIIVGPSEEFKVTALQNCGSNIKMTSNCSLEITLLG